MIAHHLCSGILVLCASGALGADLPDQPGGLDQPPAARETQLVISTRVDFAGRSDLNGGRGRASVARWRGGLEVGIPVAERSELSIGWEAERSWYRFKDSQAFIPGGPAFGSDGPIKEAWDTALTLRFSTQVDQNWSWFIGGILRATGADGANFGDSITGGGFGGFRYAFDENLSIGAGLAVITSLEDDAVVIPLPQIDWRITEKLRLTTEGPGARLSYTLCDWADVFFRGAYELREFRLEDDGAKPVPAGVLRDRRVPLVLGIRARPYQGITVDVGAGVVVGQEYRLYDRDGSRLTTAKGDTSGYFYAALRFSF